MSFEFNFVHNFIIFNVNKLSFSFKNQWHSEKSPIIFYLELKIIDSIRRQFICASQENFNILKIEYTYNFRELILVNCLLKFPRTGPKIVFQLEPPEKGNSEIKGPRRSYNGVNMVFPRSSSCVVLQGQHSSARTLQSFENTKVQKLFFETLPFFTLQSEFFSPKRRIQLISNPDHITASIPGFKKATVLLTGEEFILLSNRKLYIWNYQAVWLQKSNDSEL